jgi:hypothetical protein
MTKEKLVEVFTRRLVGQLSSDSAGSFDQPLVAEYMNMAFNTVMWEIYTKGVFNLDNYTKRYPETIGATGIAVTYDSYQDLYFSILPVDMVPLPRVGSGVVKIQTLKGSALSFVPMASVEKEMLDGQEVDLIDDTIRYIVRGDIIEYTNMTSNIASVGVKIDIVRPFNAYDWDENVFIPSGQDQRFYEMTVSFATGQPIDDQLFNNQQDNRAMPAPNK